MSRTAPRTLVDREVESAVLIRAAEPAAIASRIAKWTTLEEFRLIARATEAIEDDYVDTAERALAARRIALRVRRVDGAARLTLKGPGPRTNGAAENRMEIEAPYSVGAATRVLRALSDLGIAMPRRTASRTWKRPADFLRALGLVAVQKRTTRRMVRDVALAEDPNRKVLAELAIDTVTYSIRGTRVRLCELEVEARRPEGVRVANRLPALLVAGAPDALKPWKYSKFAMGRAFEALAEEGKLARHVGAGDWFTPRGFDELEKRLKRGVL